MRAASRFPLRGRDAPRPRVSVYCWTCHARYKRVWRASVHRGHGWGLCRLHSLPQSVLPLACLPRKAG
jgi:hypothetical protein